MWSREGDQKIVCKDFYKRITTCSSTPEGSREAWSCIKAWADLGFSGIEHNFHTPTISLVSVSHKVTSFNHIPLQHVSQALPCSYRCYFCISECGPAFTRKRCSRRCASPKVWAIDLRATNRDSPNVCTTNHNSSDVRATNYNPPDLCATATTIYTSNLYSANSDVRTANSHRAYLCSRFSTVHDPTKLHTSDDYYTTRIQLNNPTPFVSSVFGTIPFSSLSNLWTSSFGLYPTYLRFSNA